MAPSGEAPDGDRAPLRGAERGPRGAEDPQLGAFPRTPPHRGRRRKPPAAISGRDEGGGGGGRPLPSGNACAPPIPGLYQRRHCRGRSSPGRGGARGGSAPPEPRGRAPHIGWGAQPGRLLRGARAEAVLFHPKEFIEAIDIYSFFL